MKVILIVEQEQNENNNSRNKMLSSFRKNFLNCYTI